MLKYVVLFGGKEEGGTGLVFLLFLFFKKVSINLLLADRSAEHI